MTRQSYLFPLLLVVATFVAYSNSLNNSFIWDDEFLIQKNSFLRDLTSLPTMLVSNSTAGFGGTDNFYRPTQNIYYLFIFQLFGESEVAFHLGNLLLHILNALLIYLLFLRISSSNLVAFAGSLLWASHPTHVEAITYISGTADPMGTLFILLSLLSYPLNKRSFWRSYALSLFFFGCALLSKEAMIVGPGLLMITIFIHSKDKWSLRTYLPSLGHWSLAVIYMILRKTVLNFDQTYQFYKTSNVYTENLLFRLYTHLATLPEYVKILFYPVDLHMERPFPVFTELHSTPVLLGAALAVSTLGAALFSALRKDQWVPLFCWLWFFGAFVPMNGVLIPVNSFILEHWLYLPSIGIFLAVAYAFHFLISQYRWLGGITLAVVCFFLIGSTLHRNNDWKDPLTFYSNILKYSEGTARVHNNLGMAYADKQDWENSKKHYLKAIELSDSYAQTHYNLARVFIHQENYSEALKHLNRSLEINPQFRFATQLRVQLLGYLEGNP